MYFSEYFKGRPDFFSVLALSTSFQQYISYTFHAYFVFNSDKLINESMMSHIKAQHPGGRKYRVYFTICSEL